MFEHVISEADCACLVPGSGSSVDPGRPVAHVASEGELKHGMVILKFSWMHPPDRGGFVQMYDVII